MEALAAKLDSFKSMWTAPLPKLAGLSAQELISVKLRREYDAFLGKLELDELVLALQYEACEICDTKFPESTFERLMGRIRDDSDMMLLVESEIALFSDVKWHLFRYLAKVEKLDKMKFMLLTFSMEQLTSDITEVKFLNDASTEAIKSGAIQKSIADAWIRVLALVDSDESLKQQVLRIFLLEVLEKIGDHSKSCLDVFMSIAKRSQTPSKLLAISCMLQLLMKFENIEHPRIYQDVFDVLSSMSLLDESTEVTLLFLDSVEILAKSTHLANFMLTKMLRALAMLAARTGRSEVSSRILQILASQKKINPTCRAWTELQIDTDFTYKKANEFKKGGVGSIHPELATLRYHIEPDIVLDAGRVLRGELTDSQGILVDFDEINPESVDLVHTKEKRNDEKVLKV